MTDLRLRPLRLDDEAEFRAAHESLAAENFSFGPNFEPDRPWAAYVEKLEKARTGGMFRPTDPVAATLLVADVDCVIVGRASIRHALDEFHATEGGHIGYCVLRAYRRRGYATEILRQSLAVARSVGVDRVLVTCDDDNVGSATVIERCGGVFESLVEPARGGTPKRRYWID